MFGNKLYIATVLLFLMCRLTSHCSQAQIPFTFWRHSAHKFTKFHQQPLLVNNFSDHSHSLSFVALWRAKLESCLTQHVTSRCSHAGVRFTSLMAVRGVNFNHHSWYSASGSAIIQPLTIYVMTHCAASASAFWSYSSKLCKHVIIKQSKW